MQQRMVLSKKFRTGCLSLTAIGALWLGGGQLFGQSLSKKAGIAINRAVAEVQSSKQLIQETLDKLVAVVAKYPDNEVTRRAELRKTINPYFDFGEMAKRSLGTAWTSASPEQRKRFVTVFSELLARTYLRNIETIEPGMVQVASEKTMPDTAGGVHRTSVGSMVKHKGETFPIDYKMYNSGAGWKVYDVIVENIGLVSNYRTEFSGVVRKKGIDGLIADLEAKTASKSS